MVNSNNILILFAPVFKKLGCEVGIEYLSRRCKGKVYGLCAGPFEILKFVKEHLRDYAGDLWHLHTEEKKWINCDKSMDVLYRIEHELGAGAVGRIIVADRRIGRGFVRSGLCRPDLIGFTSVRDPIKAPVRYVTGMYCFFDNILNKINPSSVFLYTVAGAPAYTLAEMCKARGISFSQIRTVQIGNRYLIDDDPYGTLNCVARTYQRSINGEIDLTEFKQKARIELDEFREKPKPPGYMQENYLLLKKRHPIRFTAEALLSPAKLFYSLFENKNEYFEYIYRMWFRACIEWRSVGTFFKNIRNEFFDNKYIYFPLHVSPEASTLIRGPLHTDQINVIEALAKCAPADMLILVKEHMPMVGRRPRNFYKIISRIPRVQLVGPQYNSLTLIQKSSLVAIISGTAGWEALRLRKPALIFGNVPFLFLKEGFIYEPCLSRLAEAIPKALRVPPVSDKALVLYIAACLAESFEMAPSLLWGKYDDCSVEERKTAINKIVDGILRREHDSQLLQ